MDKKLHVVTDYIAKAQPFAQPILQTLREYVHEACPEIEEVIKWNFPNFIYNGHILCSMASFKTHCAFTFWLGAQLNDKFGILNPVGETAMGQLGKLRTIDDIPEKEKLIFTLHEAMKCNKEGVKKIKKHASANQPTSTKDGEFEKSLTKVPVASEFFLKLSPSQQREYIHWIDNAKTDATREKRILQSIEWLSEYKVRNWKYLK